MQTMTPASKFWERFAEISAAAEAERASRLMNVTDVLATLRATYGVRNITKTFLKIQFVFSDGLNDDLNMTLENTNDRGWELIEDNVNTVGFAETSEELTGLIEDMVTA